MSDINFGNEETQERVCGNLQGNAFVDSILSAATQFLVSNNARLDVFKVTEAQDQQKRDENDITKKLFECRECFPPPLPFFMVEDVIRREQDRRRRDRHKTEKKRRSVINAKIAELGNMLPEHLGRAACNKKGSILRETVEYIRQLQGDLELLKQLEEQIENLNVEFRRITEIMERLEGKLSTSHTNIFGDESGDQSLQNEIPLDDYLSKSTPVNGCVSSEISTSIQASYTQTKELNNKWDCSFLSDDSSFLLLI